MSDVYGLNTNNTVLSLVRRRSSALDVGCGAGGWANELRARGIERLAGIEADERSANLASQNYDKVYVAKLEEIDLASIGNFDVIIAADVLEHLVDPWKQLERLRDCASPRCELLVSIPNARCIDFWGPIALRGRLDYTPEGGILDDGHVRWFTRRSLSNALVGAGWVPTDWRLVALGRRRTANALLAKVGLGEFLAHQIVVRASSV